MVNSPSQLDKAYAAGILDGEGSVSMTRIGFKAGHKNPYWRIVVTVSNCNADMIKWLQRRWPGGCMFNMRRGPTRRAQHRWTLTGTLATQFLSDVQPFLIVKKRRAKWALAVNLIQSRPRKPYQPYPPGVLRQLVRLRGLFDTDRERSLSARGRNYA